MNFELTLDQQREACELQNQYGHLATYPEGFFEWVTLNWSIYRRFCSLALKAKRAGHAHYGAAGIIAKMRWETEVEQRQGHFKINNNAASGMSRLAMERNNSLAGFFRTRDSASGEARRLDDRPYPDGPAAYTTPTDIGGIAVDELPL